MPTLPQIIEEDLREMDSALDDLVTKSEATAAVIIDKGGFRIAERGDTRHTDTTSLGALASGLFMAAQSIAGLIGESSFNSMYQQGEKFSLLVHDIDEHCLLVVIFRAQISVGAVRYYALSTIARIAAQMRTAGDRTPGEGYDLSVMNIAETTDLFRKRQD
jgi:predicted regulator of Ras-like GTPase activity (Roadblock/LC7/MglB family)